MKRKPPQQPPEKKPVGRPLSGQNRQTRSISLPADLADQVRTVAWKMGLGFSGFVEAAILAKMAVELKKSNLAKK